MTWKTQMACQAALAYLFSYSSARITDTSDLWTGSGKDWYDNSAKIGVRNGVPYSKDDDMQRLIVAPIAVEGKVEDFMQKTNVKRVERVLGKTGFEHLFPLRNKLYTYEGFLQAVGKFPKFCDEHGDNLKAMTDDQACKRELATMFAHFNQETGYHGWHATIEPFRQGLYHITEWACSEGRGGA